MYDFLIVGSGLFGAAFAHKAVKAGKKVLVVEKRSHIGGNIYTENIEGINVHKYGAHIFHTDNKEVWDYVNSLAEFNNYVNSPIANYKGEIYNMSLRHGASLCASSCCLAGKAWGRPPPCPQQRRSA